MPLTHQVLAAIPVPLMLLQNTGRISYYNDAAQNLLGPGLVGQLYLTRLRHPDISQAVETVFREGIVKTAGYTHSDGHHDTLYHVTVAPLNDGTGYHVVLTFEDQSALEDAGTQRSDLVANVSHELRTPLTAISGFIETLQGPAREDERIVQRFLGIMAKESERMNRLVDDILALSKVEAEERQRPTEEVEIRALVSSVVEGLLPVAQRAGVELVFENLSPETPVFVRGDEDQLRQSVLNLVENAIKYGNSGKLVTARVAMDETLRVSGVPATLIEVQDEGEGIEPRHLTRLTERFYRVDGHRSREVGGTGLGLAIVKHIVNRHRGRLKVQSELGQGACFQILLPVENPNKT